MNNNEAYFEKRRKSIVKEMTKQMGKWDNHLQKMKKLKEEQEQFDNNIRSLACSKKFLTFQEKIANFKDFDIESFNENFETEFLKDLKFQRGDKIQIDYNNDRSETIEVSTVDYDFNNGYECAMITICYYYGYSTSSCNNFSIALNKKTLEVKPYCNNVEKFVKLEE
jgi:hypothetical protein